MLRRSVWAFDSSFWGADVWRSPPERAGQVPGLLLQSSWVAMSSLRAILAGSLCQASFVWKSWQTQRNMAPETTGWLSHSNSSEGVTLTIDCWTYRGTWDCQFPWSLYKLHISTCHMEGYLKLYIIPSWTGVWISLTLETYKITAYHITSTYIHIHPSAMVVDFFT